VLYPTIFLNLFFKSTQQKMIQVDPFHWSNMISSFHEDVYNNGNRHVDELYIEPNIARGETSKILNVLALNVGD
jgi:hypothetical protein